MLRIELRAAANGQPGQGELSIHGWNEGREALEISIQRNQDGRYLDADGDWKTGPAWHALDDVREEGQQLVSPVGPWLIDPVTCDQRMAYRLSVRAGQVHDHGVVIISGTLLSSEATGRPQMDVVSEPPIVAEPEPPPPAPPPAEPPAPPPPAAKAGKPASKRWLWVLLTLFGLGLIAGGLYWWLVLRPGDDSGQKTTEATAAGGACSTDALHEASDDMVFIQSCLKSAPSSRDVLDVIASAKQAGRCNVVQRLYAYKAQAGDAVIAHAYAREYDPEHFRENNCIQAADAETAIYWYEITLDHDPEHQDAKQRLEALSP